MNKRLPCIFKFVSILFLAVSAYRFFAKRIKEIKELADSIHTHGSAVHTCDDSTAPTTTETFMDAEAIVAKFDVNDDNPEDEEF